jgi:hypothetical protein
VAIHGCRQMDCFVAALLAMTNLNVRIGDTLMNSTRDRRKPLATFDGKVFHVEFRGRHLDVPAATGDNGDVLVELDSVTHWIIAEGESEAPEVSVEDLGAILDAIENTADAAGLSIWFE